MGYKKISFDPASECPVCGAGREQTGPLRLKGEPSWRGRAFMGVNWILNICARPEAIAAMQQHGLSGFESLAIVKHRGGELLQTVRQLRFPHQLSSGLLGSNLARETPVCGHVKFLAPGREMLRFSSEAFEECPDFAHTSEWFGSGHLAVNLVLASHSFANLYLDNSWTGLRLEPIEVVASDATR